MCRKNVTEISVIYQSKAHKKMKKVCLLLSFRLLCTCSAHSQVWSNFASSFLKIKVISINRTYRSKGSENISHAIITHTPTSFFLFRKFSNIVIRYSIKILRGETQETPVNKVMSTETIQWIDVLKCHYIHNKKNS